MKYRWRKRWRGWTAMVTTALSEIKPGSGSLANKCSVPKCSLLAEVWNLKCTFSSSHGTLILSPQLKESCPERPQACGWTSPCSCFTATCSTCLPLLPRKGSQSSCSALPISAPHQLLEWSQEVTRKGSIHWHPKILQGRSSKQCTGLARQVIVFYGLPRAPVTSAVLLEVSSYSISVDADPSLQNWWGCHQAWLDMTSWHILWCSDRPTTLHSTLHSSKPCPTSSPASLDSTQWPPQNILWGNTSWFFDTSISYVKHISTNDVLRETCLILMGSSLALEDPSCKISTSETTLWAHHPHWGFPHRENSYCRS